MKFKRIRVNGGDCHDSLKVASSECQSNENSNKCRSSCFVAQGADPADFHHALVWKERKISSVEGLTSRLLMWRLSPESMWDDLENIYMLLFMYIGNGTQLALCSVSWLATGEVRRSGAGSHRLRAVAGAARSRRAL